MRIKQLPLEIANQIAAGEVIERPASIVKELLENALDAKATQIVIDITYGGLNQIKISDNGYGICSEDLPLAIAPHATSKIKELKDLFSIASMGFRGEALASITSVAKVCITSRTQDATEAARLELKNQQIKIYPCARTVGTTIDVQDIFYNAPIRKKFLKSERLEFIAIEELVKRFALSAPEVGIHLIHNGKSQLVIAAAHTAAEKNQRIKKIMGKTFVDHAVSIDANHAGLFLAGWLSGPGYQRSQNDRLWVYLNGRMIKDKLIHNAIRQAYQETLYPGKYPACLLYLSIPPELVDVNVHPTKHEVRFQEPRLVHDFLRSEIQKAFGQVSPIPLGINEIREHNDGSYQTKNISLNPQPKMKELLSQSLELHRAFAIVNVRNEYCLIDWVAVEKAYIGERLYQAPLPLVKRPLLVPLIVQPTIELMQEDRAKLALFGLDITHDRTKVVVESFPSMLPYLDVMAFLNAYFTKSPTNEHAILELLLQFNHSYSESWTSEYRQELYEYFASRLLPQGGKPGMFMILSEERCRELLYE